MSAFAGFATAAAQLGLESVLIKPTRGIYRIALPDGTFLPNIIAHATVEERHTDRLHITDHPVEQGAAISDHAFKRPAEVVLKLGWSNSPAGLGLAGAALGVGAAANSTVRNLANIFGVAEGVQSALNGGEPGQIDAIYQQLLQLQVTRALFVVYTGKRVYENMLCETLVTESDYKTANALPITMVCRQVILVNTQTVPLPQDKQADAKETGSAEDRGPVQPVDSPSPPPGPTYSGSLKLNIEQYKLMPPNQQTSFFDQGGEIVG